MRKGYLKGRGAIRTRRILREPKWVSGIIADIYSSMTNIKLNFARVVYEYHMNRFGSESLAERNIHDFFLNARIFAKDGEKYPRIALFAAFCGLRPSESFIASPSARLLETQQAHLFFLQSLHTISLQFQNSRAETQMNSTEVPLIPISNFNFEDTVELWLAPPDVLKRSIDPIFLDTLSSSEKRKLMQNVDSNAYMSDEGTLVSNVDFFMVEIMKSWISIIKENMDRVKKQCEVDHIDEEVLLSLSSFQSFIAKCNIIDSPYLTAANKKAITRSGYFSAISVSEGSPPLKPIEAVKTVLQNRCFAGYGGNWSSILKPRPPSVMRQTDQIEIAYGQYKVPLQQLLRGALRVKVDESVGTATVDEEMASNDNGMVMSVEQLAIQVKTSFVAFEEKLTFLRRIVSKMKESPDVCEQNDDGINAVEVTWDAFQILMSNVFLLQKRTSPKNLPAKEFIRDAWATPKD